MLNDAEYEHIESVERRRIDAANRSQCKHCPLTIIWKKKVYNSFGHFVVIATNLDGSEHDRDCQGKVTTYKLEE